MTEPRSVLSAAGSAREKPRANYVTNLSLAAVSGGWSGFNAAIYENLQPFFDLHYVGPIDPPVDRWSKLVSKGRRVLGSRGNFHFFSPHRLESIRAEVEQQLDADVSCTFFHGSTPWLAVRPANPYACFLDVCFATYIDIYHDARQFRPSDLQRLYDAETDWLGQARRVFFSSEWALQETAQRYGLPTDTFRVAGLGGYVDMPDKVEDVPSSTFLFVALDFERKGGRACYDAFRAVRLQWPEARLRIIGARPPADVLAEPGIEYVGLLRKSNPAERHLLQESFAQAVALVHPTTMDATPQVIIEAGYYGCPTIAPASFAIPELVEKGRTGFLVAPPPRPEQLASYMLRLKDADVRAAMRSAVREHTTSRFTWAGVGEQMANEMLDTQAPKAGPIGQAPAIGNRAS
jgi:glycosyltransferase involved in cell wall biosynthesis